MADRSPYPSEMQDRFLIRFPPGMRERVRLAAQASNRSMNAELVATLQQTYPTTLGDAEARKLLDYLLGATSPADFEKRKAEVNANLAAEGIPYEVGKPPLSQGHGVTIQRKRKKEAS
jgi:hypothetical protein